jgi:DNA-binding response OmpR family regulator
MPATTIVVAEDDRAIRELLTHHLERDGFTVLGVADGHAALRRARSAADLLVLDLGLPGVDGYDVVRTLRREERSVPIVVLTARTDEVDRVLGFELGADDYICKRFCSKSKKALREPSGVATSPPTIRERAFAAARCSPGAASGHS